MLEELPDVMTLKELANVLRVDRQMIIRADKNGTPIIPALRYHDGKKSPYRFLKSNVINYIEENAAFNLET